MGRRRCGAHFPTRRSKPRMTPACCRTPRAPLTAGKPAGGQKHRWLSSQGSNGWRVTDSSLRARDKWNDHRGWRGASLKTPRAGRLWFGGLAACRAEPRRDRGKAGTTGLRQASMSPGVEARGSSRPFGVPRALGSFGGGRISAPTTTAFPAPQTNRAAERWLPPVITGLVPVIPLRRARPCLTKRDGRDDPGHDKKRARGGQRGTSGGVWVGRRSSPPTPR